MMATFDDARVLTEHSEAALQRVRSEYQRSLHEHKVSPVLLVEIKNLKENLRSALDFTAGLCSQSTVTANLTRRPISRTRWQRKRQVIFSAQSELKTTGTRSFAVTMFDPYEPPASGWWS